jgi:hypothetical protein
MSEQPTCGQGVAANSSLPSALGGVIAAMADNLEAHRLALDVTDDAARQEHDAYSRLIGQQRQAAERLRATAEQMAGARDLPMGKHDMARMTTPRVLDAFKAFVAAEQELLELLRSRLEHDQAMLQTIAGHVRGNT